MLLERDLPLVIDIANVKDKTENIEKQIYKKENEKEVYKEKVIKPKFSKIFHILGMSFC